MPKNSDKRREEMKTLVEQTVKNHPNGITVPQIADILNLKKRGLRNYVNELEGESRIWKEGKYWKPLPMDERKPLRFQASPEETVVLYLALRMFVKQSDRRNILAETLLRKLAELANTKLHLGVDLADAAAELAQQPQDEDYEDIFQQVVRAYLQRRKLEIIYQPYKSEPFTTVIEPYLIEPSGLGFGMYSIGYSSISGKLRTYKFERILSAKPTSEPFTVPDNFPGLEILRNAWSIYYGEDTVRVVLRFAPEVARRVAESNWRGTAQFLEEDTQNPGYVILTFEVADTTDLKPWIRTWGANCEVLEPDYLRNEMIGEARAMAQLYGWQTTSERSNSHSRFSDIFGSE